MLDIKFNPCENTCLVRIFLRLFDLQDGIFFFVAVNVDNIRWSDLQEGSNFWTEAIGVGWGGGGEEEQEFVE